MQTLQYLGADAARWVFGVGATSRVGSVTLIGLFKNTGFYLADIGWLGVVFEYGAIGSILLMLVHLAGLRQAMSWARPDDALSLALGDYIIYILVSSAVYSVVFLPGELTTCMALAYYLNRTRPGRGPRMPGPPFPSARRAANPGRWLRTSFRT